MKTTLDIPRDLLEDAMSVGRFKTRTATIIGALEQLVRMHKIAALRSMRGSMPSFELNLDALRSR